MIVMFENYYFILGVVSNIFLILIFLLARSSKMSRLKSVGTAYLSLSVPAAYILFMARQQEKPVEYSIFLAIFLAFLLLEWFYDFILKVSFRENSLKNWKLLVPYLALYWSMNYGFIVMSWRYSTPQGIIMLGLFILQLTANILSHTKSRITN